MSTHARIGIKRKDNSVTSIYCNYDGYIENTGIILQAAYTDTEKIEAMLKLGDMLYIGYVIADRKSVDNPEEANPSEFYARDYGEELNIYNGTIDKMPVEEYNYIYDEDKACWLLEMEDEYKPLDEVIDTLLADKTKEEKKDLKKLSEKARKYADVI